MPRTPTAAQAEPTEPTPDEQVQVLAAGLEDGPVTFTRPGVEEITVQVKDGVISTTKERRDWLLQYGVGVGPAE